MTDLFRSSHVTAALYFTDQGHYLFKYKEMKAWQDSPADNHTISKSIREPEVAAAFSHIGSDSGYLQDGVIRVGNNSQGSWFVLVNKPAKYTIEIIGKGKMTIPVPLLVLIGAKGLFNIYALATKDFSPDAVAFHAPFPNVNSTGWICWGTGNKLPKVAANKANEVIDLFLKSPFNYDLKNGKSKSCSDDITKKYPLITNKDQYPVKDMVSMNRSIGRIIDEHIQDRG